MSRVSERDCPSRSKVGLCQGMKQDCEPDGPLSSAWGSVHRSGVLPPLPGRVLPWVLQASAGVSRSCSPWKWCMTVLPSNDSQSSLSETGLHLLSYIVVKPSPTDGSLLFGRSQTSVQKIWRQPLPCTAKCLNEQKNVKSSSTLSAERKRSLKISP